MRKVELDVNKQSQLNSATEFTRRHMCPAIVVSPDLVTGAHIARSVSRSNHKIITAVDWPKGTQYLSDKFRGMPSESISADGFEILLTANGKLGILKEIKFLSNFFRDHFPPTIELRFVLGWHMQDRTVDQFEYMVDACKQIPNPTLIRTTHLTKISSANGSIESHNSVIDKILAIRNIPIKISGNINAKSRIGCKKAVRFACTLEQATVLQKALSNNAIGQINKAVHEAEESIS